MPKVAEPKEVIEGEVKEVFELQKTLDQTQEALMANEQFRQFLELQKQVPARIDEIWRGIEKQMIDNNIKTIKGDWGSITVAEKLTWDYDSSQLPAKFFKKVVDTARLTATYRLEGKPPKAAFPRTIKYLVRRIK